MIDDYYYPLPELDKPVADLENFTSYYIGCAGCDYLNELRQCTPSGSLLMSNLTITVNSKIMLA